MLGIPVRPHEAQIRDGPVGSLSRGSGWESASTCIQVAAAAAAAAAAAKSRQSCLTLCDPIAGSPPGSAIPGILQQKTLECVAISFSIA